MLWWEKPFVRIFFFYAAGILLANYSPAVRLIPVDYYLFIIALLIVLALVLYYKNEAWGLSWINGLTVGLILFFLGVFATGLQYSKTEHPVAGVNEVYAARIIREPVIREKTVKVLLRLKNINSTKDSLFRPVKALAFFAKDSLSEALQYGDILAIKGRPAIPESPRNPGEFDYAGFLKMNGIPYTLYLRSGQWQYLGYKPGNPLIALAGKARKYLVQALQTNGLDHQRLAVVAAMLLGYDDLMNPEIEQQYVTAGAMHILCVSGLHVGIVYLVMNFLLAFIKQERFKRFVKPVLILLVIWAYALLTGMSPAVTRASVMISMFVVGSAINRTNDLFNTLAASAVLMLFINPLLLFNVGFQLSYAAVLGILIFYKPLYGLFYFRFGLTDKLWSLVVISFAAQLGTFPLAAHYFHYMPAYFWITNLFVIPLSFIIIAVGFAFVVFSWFPFVAHWLGLALSGIVYLLNLLVSLVGLMPYHGFYDLYFPWLKVFLVYGLIISFFMLFLKKQIQYLFPAMTLLLLLTGYQTLHKINLLRQEKFIVYSMNKHSALDFIRGNGHVCLVDSLLDEDPQKAEYQLENNRIALGLAKNYMSVNEALPTAEAGLFFDGEFGDFNSYRFMVIDGKFTYQPLKKFNRKLDAIIVRGNDYLDLNAVMQVLDFDLLIVDSSVPAWKRKKLGKMADALGLRYYDVRKDGALIIDLRKKKHLYPAIE